MNAWLSPRLDDLPDINGQRFPYELVLDNTIVGLCYMLKRHFLWANARMAEIFGYELHELMGQDVRMLYATDEDYEEVGLMYATFARDNHYTHERAMVKKNGELIWCVMSGRMIAPDDPNSPAVWVVQDITDRKNAEDKLRRANSQLEQVVERRTLNLRRTNEALQAEIERRREAQLASVESREKYRTLFRYLPLGVLVTSGTGEIVEINRTLQGYLGARTRSELMKFIDDGKRVHTKAGPTSLRDLIRAHSVIEGRRVLRFEFGWQAGDGARREIAVIAAPLAGNGLGTTFTFADITEQKSARERENQQQAALAHASRLSLMGQMASTLAHELGQPLNNCQTYVAGLRLLLPDTIKELPDIKLALDKIDSQLGQAGDIIRNVRSFVRRKKSEFAAVDALALVQQTLQLMEVQFREARVLPVVTTAESLPRVKCHAVEIQQVLVNLLMNALEAMSETPVERRRIDIRLSTALRSLVAIEVQDSGSGVPPDVARQLFDPYFTTKPSGLGMGLMICQTLVEAHGGSIRYLAPEGGGACFRFTILAAN